MTERPGDAAERRAIAPATDELLELARSIAGQVPDPEIPVINLQELGILRDVQMSGNSVVVTLTPTYTGCPATEAIRDDVRAALIAAGMPQARVEISLSPPWTTDWISDEGRAKLREYGIAPPARAGGEPAVSVVRFMPARSGVMHAQAAAPACPRCGSADTEPISEHGSTPCKALYRCRSCLEPFDYFKPY